MDQPSPQTDLQSASALAEVEPAAARDALRRLLARQIPAPIALLDLLVATGSLQAVEELVAALTVAQADPASPLAELAALLADRERCARVASLLAAHPDPGRLAASPEAAVAACREFFDHAVRQSEEASVALYSLGDPAALERATSEVVDLLAGLGLLAPGRTALEVGCGIGRFLPPLAGRLRAVWGTGLAVRASGKRPLSLWDGTLFHARRPGGATKPEGGAYPEVRRALERPGERLEGLKSDLKARQRDRGGAAGARPVGLAPRSDWQRRRAL